MEGNFVADVRLEDSDEVLQLPIVKHKLQKLLSTAVKKMAVVGTAVIPSSDDPLEDFLQAAGKFFGKDPTRWDQMGDPTVEVTEDGGKRFIKSTGTFSGTELHIMVEEPYFDERLPVRQDKPELNYYEKKRLINNDEEWQQVMSEQPWTPSKRRVMASAYMHAKLEADDGELAAEGCHGFWELSINKDNHADIRIDKLAVLLSKLSSSNISVATTAAAAVWGLATTGAMRRSMSELDVIPMILAALKKTLKMQTVPDPDPGDAVPDVLVTESMRSRLQLHLLGAFAVLLVDRCCRRPYLAQETDFSTIFAMCAEMPGYRHKDEQARRETCAKILTSLMQRDGEARLALINSGSLKSVLALINPKGPGAAMIQFCMASLLATMVLDDDAMELIRTRNEAPILFESCLVLLTSTLDNLHAELERRTTGHYKVGDTPEYDLYLGVRLAEASSQAMWGSAYYCIQMETVQVKMEHIVELGKMGRDCVATDQLPLSRVCHCITASLATLASHPTTALLIMDCPEDVAVSSLLLLAEVEETDVFERAGHVKASACAGLAFLACHPINAVGDECMCGPHRTKLLGMGTFGTLLRAALTTVEDPDCNMIVQQAAAIGVMYLSTMAGAVDPGELAMYASLLMDSGNSEMIEFLMAGMWILLRNGDNRKVLGNSFDPGASAGASSNIARKLNDAITLHEIHDQAQEKAALVKEQVENQKEAEKQARAKREARLAQGLNPDDIPSDDDSEAGDQQASAGQERPESGGTQETDGPEEAPEAEAEDPAVQADEASGEGLEGAEAEAGQGGPGSEGGLGAGDEEPVSGEAADGAGGEVQEGGEMAAVEDAPEHGAQGEEQSAQEAGAGSAEEPAAGGPGSAEPGSRPASSVMSDQLGSQVPSAGLGALNGGKDSDGNNLPRGGGEEGGAPDYGVNSIIKPKKLKGKKDKLDARFKKQLKDNWGLETLVTVGESWLPAMLEQDEMGEPTDIPVLKLFEFLVASICLFMIEDDCPPEARELDMFKLSAPRPARSAQATWWTVAARAPEPEPILDAYLERALGILTQIVGMRLLAAWKSIQLGVLTLWNACARNAAMERHVVERGVTGKLLSIINTPDWPNSLRDIAGGCLEFYMERFSNLSFMPPTTLPETCPWPYPAGPQPGMISALLGYITLVNSRLPLLEYRGCHGLARVCFASPYGTSPESGREYLRDAKTAATLLGALDALVALLKRTNKRYQDLVNGRQLGRNNAAHSPSSPHRPATALSRADDDEEDTAQYERDMANIEAQQDLFFVALAALMNISVLKSAQPMLARKGLPVLLGTSTMMYGRVASASEHTLQTEAETKLLHLVSYVLQNLSHHPANRTIMYKAELMGTAALDKLIEHTNDVDEELKATASLLPPLTKVAQLSIQARRTFSPGRQGSNPNSPSRSPGHLQPAISTQAPENGVGSPRQEASFLPATSPKKSLNKAQRISPNGAILNASLDTQMASVVRPKVIFPPILEQRENVWPGQGRDSPSPSGTRRQARRNGLIPAYTDEEVEMMQQDADGAQAAAQAQEQDTDNCKTKFLNWLENTFNGDGDGAQAGLGGSGQGKDDHSKRSYRKVLWDEAGDWLEVDLESSKALSKLLCRPLHHLWNDGPEAKGRHGKKRWQPAISEYREVADGSVMQRPAQRLLSTQLPKDDEGLMVAATQMLATGKFDQTAAVDKMGVYSMQRPSTRQRDQGRLALTVLETHPEVVLAAHEAEEALQEAAAQAATAGRQVDISELKEQVEAARLASNTKTSEPTVPLKVVMGPQRSRQVISFSDRVIANDDTCRPTLTLFEHIDGSRVCTDMFPSYQLPNGKKAYMYYNAGGLLDEVAVDAVIPPPRPSTVPAALQQSMPLADVLNLIAKPPGSAPPFIPYKPVPYLVPLPSKHTLPVKRPDLLAAHAFGDLREDNLQLVMQARKIIKTQTNTRVENVEVKAVEAREPWTLPASIFKPRAKESDARNFHDTPATLEKMFERDWARACSKEKFTSMMAREHKANSKAGSKDDKAMLQEVHDVLLEFYQLWYSAFIYYAAGGGNDPYHLPLNAYTALLDECQIADSESQFIKRSDCDTIFIVCNFQPDKKSPEAAVNIETAMMRYEFLESIVRAAIAKYGRGQATEDVAESVRMLLDKNIGATLCPAAKHVSNDFRIDRLYQEEVDLLLKRHQVMLKALYSRYRLKPPGGGLRTKALRLEGWLQMCNDAHLVDSQFTLTDAELAFLWSRMFVVDEVKDYQRYSSLTFIDFLEALGRVADMKSLPTQADLDSAGYQNILDWATDKERMEGNQDSRQEGADGLGSTDVFRTRESATFGAPKTRPLYVKLELLLDLLFRRLFSDPSNPDMVFNYDGLLKLIKKIDKELGP